MKDGPPEPFWPSEVFTSARGPLDCFRIPLGMSLPLGKFLDTLLAATLSFHIALPGCHMGPDHCFRRPCQCDALYIKEQFSPNISFYCFIRIVKKLP